MFLYLVLLTSCFPLALAMPTGAPSYACDTMTPQHGTTSPQTSVYPGQLSVSSTTFQPGGVVQIMVTGTYRGILLQARVVNGANTIVRFGDWVDVPTNYQILQCSNGGTAITHSNNVDKQNSAFFWQAPVTTPVGTRVVLYVTIVQDFNTYWTQQMSQVLTATSSGQQTPPTTVQTVPTTGTMSPHLNFVNFQGCGQGGKSCFYYGSASGSNCVDNCEYKMSIQTNSPATGFISVEMVGYVDAPSSGIGRWLGVGFSHDSLMGDDDVYVCQATGNGASPVLRRYWNPLLHNPSTLQTSNPAFLGNGQTLSYIGGYMMCRFSRPIAPSNATNPHAKDLSQPLHIIFTYGTVGSGGELQRHIPPSPARTSDPVQLTVTPVSVNLAYAGGGGGSMNVILVGTLIAGAIGVGLVALLVWYLFG